MLWGLIGGGINFGHERTQAYALAYKGVIKRGMFPPDGPCKPHWQYTSSLSAWISAGYFFANAFFDPYAAFERYRPKSDNPRFESCKKTDEKAVGPFKYWLLDDIGGTGHKK